MLIPNNKAINFWQLIMLKWLSVLTLLKNVDEILSMISVAEDFWAVVGVSYVCKKKKNLKRRGRGGSSAFGPWKII